MIDKNQATLNILRMTSGGCICQTKTPEVKYHDESCEYRLIYQQYTEKLASYSEPCIITTSKQT